MDTNHTPDALQHSISPLVVTDPSQSINQTLKVSDPSSDLSVNNSDQTSEGTSQVPSSPLRMETDSDATAVSSRKCDVFKEEEVALGRPVSPDGNATTIASDRTALPESGDHTISVEKRFQASSEVASETLDEITPSDSTCPVKLDASCPVESNVKSTSAIELVKTSTEDGPATSLEAAASPLMDTDSTQSEVTDLSSIQPNSKQPIESVHTSSMETDSSPLLVAVPSPTIISDATKSAEMVSLALIKLDAVQSVEALGSLSVKSDSSLSVDVVATLPKNASGAPLVNVVQTPTVILSTDNELSDAQSQSILTTSEASARHSDSLPAVDGQILSQSLPTATNGDKNILNGHNGITCPGMKTAENSSAEANSAMTNGSADRETMLIDVDRADAYRETAIVIEDSDEESWTSDSEEDSSSDEGVETKKSVESSSSESSSDEEEEEDLEQKQARLKEKELVFKKNQTKRDNKNCRLPKELLLTDLPCIEDLQISVPEEEAQAIGEVTGIVEELVIVEAYDNLRPIDLDSVLFLKQGSEALGKVFDVFGCVNKPSYCVRFNNKDHIVQREISVGDQVFFAPRTDHCKFVDVEDLMRYRGSDASWEHDKEPPPSCVDYSDDEEEQTRRRTKKNLVRNLDQTGPSGRVSVQKKPRTDNYFSRPSDTHHRNRQAHQQPNNNFWNNQKGSERTNRVNNQGTSRSSGFAPRFARGHQGPSNAYPQSWQQNNLGDNRQQPSPDNRFYSASPSPSPAYFTAPPPCPSPVPGLPPPAMSKMSMPPPPPSPQPVSQSPGHWDTAPYLPSTTALPPPNIPRPSHPPPPTAGFPMTQAPPFFRSPYGNTHSDPNTAGNAQFSRPPPTSQFATPEQLGGSSLWHSASNPNLHQWSQPPPLPPPPPQQNVNQSYQPMTSSPVKYGSATNSNSFDLSRPPPTNPNSFGSAASFPQVFPTSAGSAACSARDPHHQNAASVATAHPTNFFNQPPPPGTNFQQNPLMLPNAFGSAPPPPPPERHNDASHHGGGLHFSQMNFGNQGY